MSKFQDLCALYAAWDDTQTDNTKKLWRATFHLMQGWAKYMDAPAIFGDRKTGEAIRYADAMRHERGYDGMNMPVPVKSYHDAIEPDGDGFVRFSIATALERDPDAYPKFRVGVFLRMKVVGETIHVQLLDKTYIPFELDQNDPTTHVKLFEAMADLLETTFKQRPGDESRLPSIGFALVGSSPDPEGGSSSL
jgi:hypothetical protein